jgi:hypothetical protein
MKKEGIVVRRDDFVFGKDSVRALTNERIDAGGARLFEWKTHLLAGT